MIHRDVKNVKRVSSASGAKVVELAKYKAASSLEQKSNSGLLIAWTRVLVQPVPLTSLKLGASETYFQFNLSAKVGSEVAWKRRVIPRWTSTPVSLCAVPVA